MNNTIAAIKASLEERLPKWVFVDKAWLGLGDQQFTCYNGSQAFIITLRGDQLAIYTPTPRGFANGESDGTQLCIGLPLILSDPDCFDLLFELIGG